MDKEMIKDWLNKNVITKKIYKFYSYCRWSYVVRDNTLNRIGNRIVLVSTNNDVKKWIDYFNKKHTNYEIIEYAIQANDLNHYKEIDKYCVMLDDNKSDYLLQNIQTLLEYGFEREQILVIPQKDGINLRATMANYFDIFLGYVPDEIEKYSYSTSYGAGG